MTGTPFLKMHGLGNDFVVLDVRATPLDLSLERRRSIADRRLGVGCDQLIVLEPPTDGDADVFMRIFNPDGGEAGACGNATRCVASVVMDERKTDQVTVQTISGLLESQKTMDRCRFWSPRPALPGRTDALSITTLSNGSRSSTST